MRNNDLVWYACYGSNLHTNRFLCYIQGGIPENSTKMHTGCRNKTLPADSGSYKIKYPLYFAGNASHWNNGGSCFLGLNEIPDYYTLGKKYLITAEQFLDITRQENNDNNIIFDFDEIMQLGSKIVAPVKYGNLLYLGKEGNYPVFSFTTAKNMSDAEFNKPDPGYLYIIGSGIMKTWDLSAAETAGYFLDKKGVAGNYTRDELVKILLKQL